MTNDVFVAFWAGAVGGAIFGIVISAILVTISNKIEGGRK